MSDQTNPSIPLVIQLYIPKKTKVFLVITVLIIASVVGYSLFSKAKQQLNAPTLSELVTATKDSFSTAYSDKVVSGETVSCTYSRTKWEPGYKTTCYIFNDSNSGIGHVDFTATTPSGSQAWNYITSTFAF